MFQGSGKSAGDEFKRIQKTLESFFSVFFLPLLHKGVLCVTNVLNWVNNCLTVHRVVCNTQLLLLGLLLLALMLESHIFAYFLLGQHSVKRPPFHPQISHNFVLSNKINSPPPHEQISALFLCGSRQKIRRNELFRKHLMLVLCCRKCERRIGSRPW